MIINSAIHVLSCTYVLAGRKIRYASPPPAVFDFTALYCFPVIVHGQAVQQRLLGGSVVGRITSQNNKGGADSKEEGGMVSTGKHLRQGCGYRFCDKFRAWL